MFISCCRITSALIPAYGTNDSDLPSWTEGTGRFRWEQRKQAARNGVPAACSISFGVLLVLFAHPHVQLVVVLSLDLSLSLCF